MLVLSRKVGQRILIGDKIAVTVVRVGQGGVRIGIEAPTDMEVVREELKDATHRDQPVESDSASACQGDAHQDRKSRLGAPK